MSAVVVVIVVLFTLVAAKCVVLLALGAGPAELCSKVVSKKQLVEDNRELTASSLLFLSMFFEK